MPWSAGTYTLPRDMTDDDSAGIPIVASNFDEQFEDIRDGVNLTLTKDGQNEPTANLPMGTFRHTNVGVGVAATDYLRIDQAQQGFGQFARAATSANNFEVALSPSAVIADGMVVNFITSTSNVSASPTLQVGDATARELQYKDGNAITQNDLPPGAYTVVYDVSADTFKLLNYGLAGVAGTIVPGLVGLAVTANMSAGGNSAAAVESQTHGNIIVIETSVTVTGFSATDDTVDYKLTRHGREVTLDVQQFTRTDGTGTTMGLVSGVIPAGMRPLGTKVFPVRINNATAAFGLGLAFVTQAGGVGFNISIEGSAFSAGNTARGWDNFAITWVQAN